MSTQQVTLLGMAITGTPDDKDGEYLHLQFSDGTWAISCPIGVSKEMALAAFKGFIKLIQDTEIPEGTIH